jgi:ribose-phosphate pyrophosphokinase
LEETLMHIIDSDNYAASGIETLFFPGGEPHAKLPQFQDDVLFFGKLRTWNDVGIAACVLNTLDQQHINLHSFFPYFPGARQDKYMRGAAPLTITTMFQLLGGGTSDTVSVFDPHSGVLGGLFDGSGYNEFDFTDLIHFPMIDDVEGIIAPDKGAIARATKFRDVYFPYVPLIECTKTRDPVTGQLGNYEFPKDVVMDPGRYIVVDDICDGGGTFNLLADAFRKRTRWWPGNHLTLVVSHGIFSKGLDALSGAYDQIITTNSWCKLPSGGRLTVLPLEQLFPRIIGA